MLIKISLSIWGLYYQKNSSKILNVLFAPTHITTIFTFEILDGEINSKKYVDLLIKELEIY